MEFRQPKASTASKLVDARLLEILACPLCKGQLTYNRSAQELICSVDKLAYPIRDGIPVMLAGEARQTVEGTLVDSSLKCSTSTSTFSAD